MALNYAVMGSDRGGSKSATSESAEAGAAQFQQYMTLLRNEVQRLMVVNGCTWENLDWRTSGYLNISGSNSNQNVHPPYIPKAGCAVFTSQGGPVAPQNFEKYTEKGYSSGDIYGQSKPGHAKIAWLVKKNTGTGEPEIVILFNAMSLEFCRAVLRADSTSEIINDAWSAEYMSDTPVAYTANGSTISDTINLRSDDFARLYTSPVNYCVLGSVVVPR